MTKSNKAKIVNEIDLDSLVSDGLGSYVKQYEVLESGNIVQYAYSDEGRLYEVGVIGKIYKGINGATWRTADGRLIPIEEITNDHLSNIIKYMFTQNVRPQKSILNEAARRGLLRELGRFIPPREGYKSPEELTKELDYKYAKRTVESRIESLLYQDSKVQTSGTKALVTRIESLEKLMEHLCEKLENKRRGVKVS